MKKIVLLALSTLILVLAHIVNAEMSNNTTSFLNDNNYSYNNSYNTTSDTYKVFVDGYHGFYRVYNVNTGEELIGEDYEDKTLNIRVGDTVIWSNEDPVETFTILSDPKLWTEKVGYIKPAKMFNYTFNQSGMYDVYIRQDPDLQHQTVIVDSLNLSTNKTTIEQARERAVKTIVYKNQTGNKSKVTIKIYRKPRNTPKDIPGFEIIMIMPIIAIVYILRKIK